jgi:hypothetical protein
MTFSFKSRNHFWCPIFAQSINNLLEWESSFALNLLHQNKVQCFILFPTLSQRRQARARECISFSTHQHSQPATLLSGRISSCGGLFSAAYVLGLRLKIRSRARSLNERSCRALSSEPLIFQRCETCDPVRTQSEPVNERRRSHDAHLCCLRINGYITPPHVVRRPI